MPAIPAGNNLSARQFSMQEVIAKSVIGKGTDSIDTPSSSINQMLSTKSYGTAEKNLESVLSFIQTSINDNGEAKALTSSAQASPATVFSPLSNGIVTSQNMNPVQTTISTPLQHQTWGEQMVQQIKQFTLEKIGVAEIKIAPQELGPIRVEIALDNNDAAIHFAAQQQETRDALLHHMNRLKEALSEAGVQLQSATTGSFSNGQAFSFLQQQSRERNSGSNYQSSSGLASLAETSILPPSAANTPIKSGRSGVDLFV
jgi:flagellar hook-length control protein FliK